MVSNLYPKEIIVCFDGDAVRQSFRVGRDITDWFSGRVYAARLPCGKDPNDLKGDIDKYLEQVA